MTQGRPLKVLDLKQIKAMAAIGCTQDEINKKIVSP
jgi:hypothetical protein